MAVGIFVITTLGVTLGTIEERQDRLEEAHADALTLARAVKQYVARVLHRTGVNLVDLRGTIEGVGGLASVPPLELEILSRRAPVDHAARRYILIADHDGRTLAFGGGGANVVPNVAGHDAFKFHRANLDRTPRVSPPFRATRDGRWRLPISVRIDRRDGTFGGIVMTTLDVEYLAEYFETLGVPHRGAIALIAPTGEFLARHPALPADIDNRLKSAGRMFDSAEGDIAALSPIDGLERLGAYRRLGDDPLYITVTFSKDDLLAYWRRNAVLRCLGGLGVLGLTAFFTFVLLRRLKEERVASINLAKFRRAVDLSGDYIYWLDDEGRIAYMNDAASRRLGHDPKKLPAQLHLRELSATYTEDKWRTLREVLLRRGETSYLSEHAAHDGTSYPVQVSATHVEIEGRNFGFLIARDLSDLVRQQAEIHDLNATLERRVEERTAELADANADLESFGYSVSHDLRAPLNHMSAYAESLAEVEPGDRVEYTRLAGKIVERSEYMTDLVDALLVLSRVGRAQLDHREMDLGEIAAEIDAGHRKLEPERNVLTRIQPGMRAKADPILLRTLLENLIGNAWKYSSKVPQARIEICTEAVDGTRAFVVRDNGAGFDPRYAARLFGPFVRLHNQSEFKGNGVGLATARRIVSRHGGRIWAESAPGAGATFRFTLG